MFKYFLLSGRGGLETSGADSCPPEVFIPVLSDQAGCLHHHQRPQPLQHNPGLGEGVEHQAQPPPAAAPVPAWNGGHDGNVQGRVRHSFLIRS